MIILRGVSSVTCTKRGLQNKLKTKGLPWERAKAFNGAAVFSAFNDEIIQVGGAKLMMYKPAEILAELKTFMALYDVDIIMTGTPSGVGVIVEGACFKGRVLSDNKEIVSAYWTAI